jgi:hypothetical protein
MIFGCEADAGVMARAIAAQGARIWSPVLQFVFAICWSKPTYTLVSFAAAITSIVHRILLPLTSMTLPSVRVRTKSHRLTFAIE